MKLTQLAVGLSAVCLVVSSITLVLVFEKGTSESYAFIKTSEVYDQFELKKELAAQYTQIENSRKLVLDSMKVRMDQLERQLRATEAPSKSEVLQYQNLGQELNELNNSYTQELQEVQDRFNEQIWSRINQYVKDYGDEKGIELIFGANGNGNIMHGGNEKDITNEVTAYINEKYSGAPAAE